MILQPLHKFCLCVSFTFYGFDGLVFTVEVDCRVAHNLNIDGIVFGAVELCEHKIWVIGQSLSNRLEDRCQDLAVIAPGSIIFYEELLL